MTEAIEVTPKCTNCFWFKIKWSEEKCVCTHPQHRNLEISLSDAMEKSACNGVDRVYRHERPVFER